MHPDLLLWFAGGVITTMIVLALAWLGVELWLRWWRRR